MAGRLHPMPGVQHTLVVPRHASDAAAHSRLRRCQSVIEGRKLALEAPLCLFASVNYYI